MALSFSRMVLLDRKQIERKKDADEKIQKNIKNALQTFNKNSKLQEECTLNAMEKGY